MKPSSLFLAGSIILNVAFGAAYVLGPETFGGATGIHGVAGESPAGASATAPAKTASASASKIAQPSAALWPSLQADDLRTLIARLRAAGFPPAAIRAVVTAQVDARFATQLSALSRISEDTPYWKPSPSSTTLGDPKFLEERQQIMRERARLLRELVGSESGSYAADPTVEQRRRFGDLTPAKIALLDRINADYGEMSSQVRLATRGIVLPEDQEKIALLEREKRADLSAALTPQELADYDLRNSTAIQRLRTPLTLIDATEQEFRTIYEIHQKNADRLYPNLAGGMLTPDTRQKMQEATAQTEAAVNAALGEARAAEFARASNNEFQQLASLAQRENRPLSAAVEAYNLRTSISEESARIGNDRTLSSPQKRAALQTLAQTARSQFGTALGPAGESYARSSDWLRAIENGAVVTFSGTTTSFRSLPP